MGRMKRILLLALVVPVVFSSCMTSEVLAKAEGKPTPGESDEIPPPPKPGYYALLPVSVAVDLIFWPFGYFAERENARQRVTCH
jgi:hypothetical protein